MNATNGEKSDKKQRMSFEERHRCILDAALKLFSKLGFHGTTTRRLAKEAGVNEALLYRHFQSKETILLALLSESQGRLDPHGLRQSVEDLPPRQALRKILEFVAHFTGHFKKHNAIVIGQLHNSPEAQEVFRGMIEERVQAFFPLFAKWRREGAIKEIHPAALFRTVIGALVFYHHTQPVMAGTDLDVGLDEIISGLETMILKDPAEGTEAA